MKIICNKYEHHMQRGQGPGPGPKIDSVTRPGPEPLAPLHIMFIFMSYYFYMLCILFSHFMHIFDIWLGTCSAYYIHIICIWCSHVPAYYFHIMFIYFKLEKGLIPYAMELIFFRYLQDNVLNFMRPHEGG